MGKKLQEKYCKKMQIAKITKYITEMNQSGIANQSIEICQKDSAGCQGTQYFKLQLAH